LVDTSKEPVRERVTSATLARSLLDMGALRFGGFKLPNGRRSQYDIDLRLIPSFPDVYITVLAAYVELVEGIHGVDFDAICGVATAGLTVSSPLAIMLKKPMMYVRKEGEGRGEGRLVEGIAKKGANALIIDDLVSSGASLVKAALALRKAGYRVTDVAVLVDRMEGGRENLAANGVRLHSYTDVREVLRSLKGSKGVRESDVVAALRQAGPDTGGRRKSRATGR
jgi:orotate phosphoribosyltransferase